jgi:hypothetical protein
LNSSWWRYAAVASIIAAITAIMLPALLSPFAGGYKEAATWIILLMLAAPLTLYLGTHLLAETVFAALSTWAILLMVRIGRGHASSPLREALLLALACALAFNTRTIGFTLLPAAAMTFWQRRRLDIALAFGLTWLALCLPWFTWQMAHHVPPDHTLAYYTQGNYSSWNVLMSGGSSLPSRVVSINLGYLALVPAWLWNIPGNLQIPWLLIAVMALAVAGSVRFLRGELAPLGVWVLTTGAVVSLWTWPPLRFLLPVVPVYLVALAPGSVARRSRLAVTAGRAIAIALLLLAWSQYLPVSWHAGWWNRDSMSRTEQLEGRDVMDGVAWVAQNTPAEAIIAANLDPIYWLYSGRRAIRAFAADPYELYYAPNAPADALGDEHTLRDLLLEHRVTHLVLEDLALFQESKPLRAQLDAFERRWPDVLAEAWQSQQGLITVYTVSW